MTNDDLKNVVQAMEEDWGAIIVTKLVACYLCSGKGRVVNPAVDGSGISREDFDEDPQFRSDYFEGVYDITCPDCHGKNVVLEVDRKATQPESLELFDAIWIENQETYDIEAAERRAGA